jgi:hypothetical protein
MDYRPRRSFPSYALSNLNGNLARNRQRLARLLGEAGGNVEGLPYARPAADEGGESQANSFWLWRRGRDPTPRTPETRGGRRVAPRSPVVAANLSAERPSMARRSRG